jgi:hypothetical protein
VLVKKERVFAEQLVESCNHGISSITQQQP